MTEILLTGRVDQIPNLIELDVSEMEDGDTMTLADIEVPEGITYLDPEDTLVAAVREPRMELEEEEEETEELEGEEVEGAEGEEGEEADEAGEE